MGYIHGLSFTFVQGLRRYHDWKILGLTVLRFFQAFIDYIVQHNETTSNAHDKSVCYQVWLLSFHVLKPIKFTHKVKTVSRKMCDYCEV